MNNGSVVWMRTCFMTGCCVSSLAIVSYTLLSSFKKPDWSTPTWLENILAPDVYKNRECSKRVDIVRVKKRRTWTKWTGTLSFSFTIANASTKGFATANWRASTVSITTDTVDVVNTRLSETCKYSLELLIMSCLIPSASWTSPTKTVTFPPSSCTLATCSGLRTRVNSLTFRDSKSNLCTRYASRLPPLSIDRSSVQDH